MKRMFFVLLYSVLVVNILTGVNLYKTKSHTLLSFNEIIAFTDPFTGRVWGEEEIKGVVIVSWNNEPEKEGRGFCNIVFYIPWPEGGKYKISLIYVTYSDADTIQGIWAVTGKNKEETLSLYKQGVITNLNYPVGHIIELNLGELNLKARISFNCAFPCMQPEITGQIKKNHSGLNGARVSLKQETCEEEDILPTCGDGNYSFLVINPDSLEHLTIHFLNTGEAYFSGHIYVLGMPWENAGIDILVDSRLVNTITTDDYGFFEFDLTDEQAGAAENSFVDIMISLM
jgi:hypothetical protein